MPFSSPVFHAGYQKGTNIFNSNQKSRKITGWNEGASRAGKLKRADMKIIKTRLLRSAFPVQTGQRRAFRRDAFSLYTVYKNRMSVKEFQACPPGTKKAANKMQAGPAKAENRGILVN